MLLSGTIFDKPVNVAHVQVKARHCGGNERAKRMFQVNIGHRSDREKAVYRLFPIPALTDSEAICSLYVLTDHRRTKWSWTKRFWASSMNF
jgi:hypothetical protein